jgi:hypothetical protein
MGGHGNLIAELDSAELSDHPSRMPQANVLSDECSLVFGGGAEHDIGASNWRLSDPCPKIGRVLRQPVAHFCGQIGACYRPGWSSPGLEDT